MDKEIKDILAKITKENYEAFLVGGFVRDFLLGKKTRDIDICTNAPTEFLENMFSSSLNTFGGFNYKINDKDVTITRYRIDLEYKNGFPILIDFNVTIEEDLKRRDFTINAMLMDKNEKIIDLVGGINDLNNKVICMIGDPLTRIKEDPIRILRAIRLAINLDFTIEENLKNVIKNNLNLLDIISIKRLNKELLKIKKNNLSLFEELNLNNYLKLRDIIYK